VGISQDGEENADSAAKVGTSANEELYRFRALYETHYPSVYTFVLRRLFGSREDALDVTAEIFATAWRRATQVPPPPEDRLWLFGVARRILSRHQRGHLRRARLLVRLESEASVDRRIHDESVSTPSDRERVQAAIARLKFSDRDLLSLVLWDQFSHSEAAQVLGCSTNAVGLRLHKAKSRLRRELMVDQERHMRDAEDLTPPKREHENES
jgi:RNA polymerase sigma-70 factor (ECF subfamily)